jgi:hypothetical protein
MKQFRDEARAGGHRDAASNQVFQQLCSRLIHKGEPGKVKACSAWPSFAGRAGIQDFKPRLH